MKSLDLLKKIIVQESENKLFEIADSLRIKLLNKYKEQTKDSEETIVSYINDFEKVKQRLTGSDRDITKYSYKDLKIVIDREKTLKTIDQIYTQLKKKEPNSGVSATELKPAIKKFLEIGSDIPPDARKKIATVGIKDFIKIADEIYSKIMPEKLLEKFLADSKEHTKEQIVPYIKFYIENYNEIPLNTKKVTDMSFYDLELLVNGITAAKDLKLGGEKQISDIEIPYDENNLKIFAPQDRDQCIRLRNGKSWCTSASGSRSYYYNYRYKLNLTLYYVIDEDMPENDINKYSVILVTPNGRYRLADGTNSGRYSGHEEIPFSEIVKKIPKLANLEYIFKPRPLTEEEMNLVRKLSNISVDVDVMKSFDSEKEAELWMEIHSHELTNEQYASLTPNLKKKYIGLGYSINKIKLMASEPEVMEYFLSRKVEQLKNKGVKEFDESDIVLLKTPKLKKLKDSLKEKFVASLIIGDDLEITYPSGQASLYGELYGWDDFFSVIPKTIKKLKIKATSENPLEFVLPDRVGEFSELKLLSMDNCISQLNDNIGNCKKLFSLILKNNPNLKSLPSSIMELQDLNVLFIADNPQLVVSPEIIENLEARGVSIMPERK